jgi:hypothetical protein
MLERGRQTLVRRRDNADRPERIAHPQRKTMCRAISVTC